MNQDACSAQSRVAIALGVLRDAEGSACAICGPSPFATAGPRTRVLGPNFAGHETLHGHADVCRGCEALLSGRPGRQPPPLRMRTVYLDATGGLHDVTAAEVGALLLSPPPGPFVLSWGESKKKHHILHAGLSDTHTIRCGHDDGPIRFEPERHAPVVAAVRRLIAHWPRQAVRRGAFDGPRIATYGPARWRVDAETIEPHRGARVVDLLAWALPPAPAPTEGDAMIDADDEAAATLLAAIAHPSERRRSDGRQFWGGFLRHRVERFSRLPLGGCVSRLLDDCGVPASQADGVVRALASASADETRRIEEAFRTRAGLVTALAYMQVKQMGGRG